MDVSFSFFSLFQSILKRSYIFLKWGFAGDVTSTVKLLR